MTAPLDQLPAPLDQKIVTEIARLLRRISKVNGFRTDAGRYVLDEESQDEPPADAIFLEVLDDDEETGYQSAKRRTGHLQLIVAIGCPVGEVDHALRAEARIVLADIRRALSQREHHQWAPGVTGLEIGGRTMFVREAGSRYFRPELRLRVAFTETH